MVHLTDLDWNRSGEDAIKDYEKGQMVQAKILDVDPDKERISLGIKQVGSDPMDDMGDVKRGDDVTCTVTSIESGGVEVQIGGDNGMKAFIRKSDLSKDRNEQRPERFAVGDRVDARVTGMDRTARRITLSIKAREAAEEKEAVEQFGSADSGASLGDILGAALKDGGDKDE
ncbi:MAG: S1 RNA-binding domain-containing protein, partial [Pseudomonadota bacterium]